MSFFIDLLFKLISKIAPQIAIDISSLNRNLPPIIVISNIVSFIELPTSEFALLAET